MDDEDLVYSLEITNGYIFRQIFELYVRLVIQTVPIFFKEDGITIRTGSGSKNSKRIVSNIEIFTEDIIEYNFNKELATVKGDDETSSFTVEQFNIKEIGDNFKSITKTGAIRIYKKKDAKCANIEFKNLTTDTSWLECIKLQSIDYDLSIFDSLSEIPNIKIEINQFCSVMKSMTRGKPEYIAFKVYEKGLAIESRNSNGSLIKKSFWGEAEGDFFETKANDNVNKALCKINNMSINGIIKFYSNKDKYLKLSHKIGDFGEHNIYLIDEVLDD